MNVNFGDDKHEAYCINCYRRDPFKEKKNLCTFGV